MRIPPLKIKIMLQSNPLKSRILVRRLAVLDLSLRFPIHVPPLSPFSNFPAPSAFSSPSASPLLLPLPISLPGQCSERDNWGQH